MKLFFIVYNLCPIVFEFQFGFRNDNKKNKTLQDLE